MEVSTRKRKALGEFVECQPDSKRCKVTYDTTKADQWLPVAKPTKGHGWQITGYGLWAEKPDEEYEEGSAHGPDNDE